MNNKVITILGPTAVGKTKLAAELAFHFNGEIISADSRQVYKGMDIGTGKDLSDYTINNQQIPYHLIDILSPKDEFNLFQFVTAFDKAYEQVLSKNKQPFLVGGTGLYIHSLLKGYNISEVKFDKKRVAELEKFSEEELKQKLFELNPKQHNTTDLIDKERIIKAILIAENQTEENQREKLDSLVLGVTADREIIKKRITARLKHRLKNGMIEETEKLLADGVTHEKLHFFGLEYKFLSLYLQGELNYNDMFQKLNSSIHKFAKRQMTWFRKMEKEGIEIHWVEGPDFTKAKEIIEQNLDTNAA